MYLAANLVSHAIGSTDRFIKEWTASVVRADFVAHDRRGLLVSADAVGGELHGGLVKTASEESEKKNWRLMKQGD